MKTSLRAFAVLCSLAVGSAVFAGDKPADKKEAPPAEKGAAGKDAKQCQEKDSKCEKCPDQPKLVMLTGSRIPQRITKLGRITDGMNAVSVYSRADLESTGETDVASALRRLSPSIR
ncbi:MAG: hypothetical protein HY302_12550 [Opitutae bacterium]|nr:hypothetical protein [Opitutae bacterium]